MRSGGNENGEGGDLEKCDYSQLDQRDISAKSDV